MTADYKTVFNSFWCADAPLEPSVINRSVPYEGAFVTLCPDGSVCFSATENPKPEDAVIYMDFDMYDGVVSLECRHYRFQLSAFGNMRHILEGDYPKCVLDAVQVYFEEYMEALEA